MEDQAKKMEDQAKLQEKAIDEIIKRYGNTIDLKKSPYLIVEIVQQFQELLGEGRVAACAPPGGPPDLKVAECAPPGGPPDRDDFVVLIDRTLREISQLSTAIGQLHIKVDELKK